MPSHTDRLTMFVLYENPLDYPGQFVIRGQDILFKPNTGEDGKIVPHESAVVCVDRDQIVKGFEEQNPGLVWIGREDADEPQIVGSWV